MYNTVSNDQLTKEALIAYLSIVARLSTAVASARRGIRRLLFSGPCRLFMDDPKLLLHNLRLVVLVVRAEAIPHRRT